jgi:hypothetical protein
MVVHDEAEVCINSHGNEDATLQHPLPAGREDTIPIVSLNSLILPIHLPGLGSSASEMCDDQRLGEGTFFCLITHAVIIYLQLPTS